jgi:2'-5' RNA ligase
MRLFLAINLPEEMKWRLARATESLRSSTPDASWVREEAIHLTLKFLGEQPAEMIDRLQAMMAALVTGHRELLMSIGGIGAFPNFRRARVVWVGIHAEARLELLHHDLEVACEELGFELDGRAFRPHLTLARIKRPLDEPAARVLARAAKDVDFDDEFVARSVDLMRSESSSTGSRYTTLMSAPLRSA